MSLCFELYCSFLRVHHNCLSGILAERKENFNDSNKYLLLERNRELFFQDTIAATTTIKAAIEIQAMQEKELFDIEGSFLKIEGEGIFQEFPHNFRYFSRLLRHLRNNCCIKYFR